MSLQMTDQQEHTPVGLTSTHANPTSTVGDAARFHQRRISSVTFTSAHLYGNVYLRLGVAHALADSGLLGSKVPPKCEIPYLGR